MAESHRPSSAPRETVDPDRATDPSSETAAAESQVVIDEGGAAPDPLAEAKAEVGRLKDQWMRTAADFDNFRKRSRRELEDARKGGREEILKELLPVFDNLARGIQSATQATEVRAVVDGLNMILKQFDATLARVGVQKVGTIGQPFDPMLHEAIQQVESSDHAPGTIVAEVQPGYMSGEKLIRAAMVVVAKPKAADPGDTAAN